MGNHFPLMRIDIPLIGIQIYYFPSIGNEYALMGIHFPLMGNEFPLMGNTDFFAGMECHIKI